MVYELTLLQRFEIIILSYIAKGQSRPVFLSLVIFNGASLEKTGHNYS